MTITVPAANAASLSDLHWQYRLIVAFTAPGSEHNQIATHWVTSNRCRLRDRDLLIINIHDSTSEELTDTGLTLNASAIASLNTRRKSPEAGFEMLLIGKDGGVKTHSEDTADLNNFIRLIDTMPMRQREAKADKCPP